MRLWDWWEFQPLVLRKYCDTCRVVVPLTALTRGQCDFCIAGVVVYRLYDERHVLLYVGCTSNMRRRFAHHRHHQEWWPEVAHVVAEVYANKRKGLDAERAAIKSEDPRYNIVHSKWRDMWVPSPCGTQSLLGP